MKKLLLFTFLLSFSALIGFSQAFKKQGAGVTILVHGWNPDGNPPAWMEAMANAIIARNGNVGHIATIDVTGTQGNLSATCSDWTFDLANQNQAEIIVLVNWTAVANHLNTGITAQEVAAAIAPKIYNGQEGEPALSELPIHLIGHSRGGGMVFEIARLLGLQGVEVEHLTSLDPHPLTAADPQPISGDVIDTPIEIYENILFVDNYYQTIEFPMGEYIDGAYNRLWTSLPGGYHNETGYTYTIGFTTYNFSDHLNIILAYHGTIDLTTSTTNGEATMTQTERDNWFNTYENAGENTGFKYSHQIIGNRKSNDIPNSDDAVVDGYHNNTLLGGNGARQSLTWTNAVWPNILETTISLNSSPLAAGVHNIETGDALDIDFIYRSYANASTVTFYADLDRNPYNTNLTAIGTMSASATGSSITANSLNWTVADLTVGETYYIFTEIDDGTNTRYLYSPYEFKLTPVATEPAAGNGSEANPYEIHSLENLYWLSQNSTFWDTYFIQTADIDAAETVTWFGGQGFPPIGNEITPFAGTYNGDNYTISNLYINRDADYIGLFSYVGTFSNQASLKNIILENIDINCSSGNAWYAAGALAGYFEYGTVDNCHSSGTINADDGVGGLIGSNQGLVTNSSSSCNVTGTELVGGFVGDHGLNQILNCSANGNVEGTSYVGGFSGYFLDSEVYNCFAKGDVSGNEFVGGFASEMRYSVYNTIVSNCYSWGNVTRLSGSASDYIGGFIAHCDDNNNSPTTVEYSYSIGSVTYQNATNPTDKGFIGMQTGTHTYTANFFNSSTSGQTSGTGATPQTTSGIQTRSTFTDVGWDFMGETTNGENDYWGINQNENSGYPFLKWQGYKLHTEVTENPTTESLQCPTALESIALTGGTANTDGSFAFANPTDIPQAGTSQHEVFFTPTDEENYSTVSLMVGVTVEDNTAPAITSTHNSQTLDADASCEASLPDYTTRVTANDNCTSVENLTITQTPTAGTVISGATNSVTLKVEDEAGNFAEVSFIVSVLDVTDPVITSTHETQTLHANASCKASLPDYTSVLTATDNCSDFANMTLTQTPEAGTLISGETNLVILKVEDEAGNFVEVSFNVEVVDNTAPVPDIAELDNIVAECEVTTLTAPTATDNCNGEITGIHYATLPITTQGTTTVTWTYDDGNGNVATQTQNVVIDDVTAPTISCIDNQDIQLSDGETFYTVQGTEFSPSLNEDNCEIAYIENDYNNASTLEGAELPVGTTTIVWTIADQAGNTSECSFDVTVNLFVNISDTGLKDISIYPNPTSGVVYFNFSGLEVQKISILDVIGKKIIEERITDQRMHIDLSEYLNGIYLIKIETETQVLITKIIKDQ